MPAMQLQDKDGQIKDDGEVWDSVLFLFLSAFLFGQVAWSIPLIFDCSMLHNMKNSYLKAHLITIWFLVFHFNFWFSFCIFPFHSFSFHIFRTTLPPPLFRPHFSPAFPFYMSNKNWKLKKPNGYQMDLNFRAFHFYYPKAKIFSFMPFCIFAYCYWDWCHSAKIWEFFILPIVT